MCVNIHTNLYCLRFPNSNFKEIFDNIKLFLPFTQTSPHTNAYAEKISKMPSAKEWARRRERNLGWKKIQKAIKRSVAGWISCVYLGAPVTKACSMLFRTLLLIALHWKTWNNINENWISSFGDTWFCRRGNIIISTILKYIVECQ